MAANKLNYPVDQRVRLLLVDDSELFRKFITEILGDSTALTIVGEAAGGLQALDRLDELKPDVVLLDMEMPGMDGMQTLHRIRQRSPVPVIMVSSLSREGSARSFDCLKNGAVDFIGKDALHPRKGAEQLKSELLYRIFCASRLQVNGGGAVTEESGARSGAAPSAMVDKRVIFCEDCGTRNVVESQSSNGAREEVRCSDCGDLLEAVTINAYRRVSSISVIGAGRGAALNLLRIIPWLPADSGSTQIVVLQENRDYTRSFCRYLNAISPTRVVELEDGMNIEGGNCYIGSCHDHFSMISHSTNFTIRKGSARPGQGALDQMFESIASIMKNRMLAMVLSGNQLDGEKGIQQVRKKQGFGVVLNAANCLCKELGENILRKSGADRIVSEQECIDLLTHFQDSQNTRVQ